MIIVRVDRSPEKHIAGNRNLHIALCGLMLATLLLMAACGARAVTPQTPPEIVYGEDVCDHCGMIISDERFAAGLVIRTGQDRYEHRRFDDIGDMLAFIQSAGEDNSFEIVSTFVHDYAEGGWLDARSAHYVHAEANRTPMGSGFAAFASAAAAEAHAQTWQATVLDFDGVLEQTAMAHDHAHP